MVEIAIGLNDDEMCLTRYGYEWNGWDGVWSERNMINESGNVTREELRLSDYVMMCCKPITECRWLWEPVAVFAVTETRNRYKRDQTRWKPTNWQWLLWNTLSLFVYIFPRKYFDPLFYLYPDNTIACYYFLISKSSAFVSDFVK